MSKVISILAVIFGCLGIISWACFITFQLDDPLIYFLILALSFICTLIGSGLAVVSAIVMFGPKKGSVVVNMTGFLVNIVSIVMLVYCICYINHQFRRSYCMGLMQISLELYKQDHPEESLDGSNWSDVLVNRYMPAEEFTVISKDKAQWNYALNANAQKLSEIPDDMVVIFSSDPGWNLVGGKELLVGDNYKGGCLVLFGNMQTRYVLPEDFDSLRWK